jgi:hypothetical protein
MKNLYNYFFQRNYRIKEFNSTYLTGWIYVTNPISKFQAQLWLWRNHCSTRENTITRVQTLNISSGFIWWIIDKI